MLLCLLRGRRLRLRLRLLCPLRPLWLLCPLLSPLLCLLRLLCPLCLWRRRRLRLLCPLRLRLWRLRLRCLSTSRSNSSSGRLAAASHSQELS